MKTKNFLNLFPQITSQELAEKIKLERKKARKTHEELFGESYSREMVRKVELGEYHPSFSLVQTLSKKTGWDYQSFFLKNHSGNTRINKKNFDEIVELYLSLPEESREIVESLQGEKVQNFSDWKKLRQKNERFKNEPLATFFFLKTLEI